MWRASRLAGFALAGLALAGLAQAQADLRAELESGDATRIVAARQQVLALPKPQQVDFFRDAIWSKVPQAAVWSANNLKHDEVDLREAARVIDLLMPELEKPTVLGKEELDFDEFRQLLGSSEVPRVLQSFPQSGEWPSPHAILSETHRQVRVAQIPALCRLAMDPNPRVALPALENLIGAVAPRTNQHRQDIGRALLHRIKVPVSAAERSKPKGYPEVLFQCVANFDRFAVLGNNTFEAQVWIWRWACAENAGPADREMLQQLRKADSDLARSIAAHGLGDLPGADRARRTARLLFHEDPKLRAAALGLCTQDRYDLALAGIRVQPGWFAGLEVPDRQLPGGFLAQVIMHVPGFRRVDLAKRAAAQTDLKQPRGSQAELDDFLAFLEVVAKEHLRTLLATWATSSDRDLRKHARSLQLRIGDETAVNELVAVLEEQELCEKAPIWLARIPSPKVEAFLRRRVDTVQPKARPRYLHALAVHYGLPGSVGWDRQLSEVSDDVFAKARRLVLEKKPIDALVCVLGSLAESERRIKDLGLVRDPRVTKHLQSLQSRRHLGLYAWATSQLAIQGSSKAREEFWQGCLIGRYRWVDNSNPRALTLNYDLETIPFWISELETNCCRRNTASQIFRYLFGLDLYQDARVVPEVVQAREFWERCRNNLRWSRIKGHYVPGPDR